MTPTTVIGSRWLCAKPSELQVKQGSGGFLLSGRVYDRWFTTDSLVDRTPKRWQVGRDSTGENPGECAISVTVDVSGWYQ